jgi:hypothetical protein
MSQANDKVAALLKPREATRGQSFRLWYVEPKRTADDRAMRGDARRARPLILSRATQSRAALRTAARRVFWTLVVLAVLAGLCAFVAYVLPLAGAPAG